MKGGNTMQDNYYNLYKLKELEIDQRSKHQQKKVKTLNLKRKTGIVIVLLTVCSILMILY